MQHKLSLNDPERQIDYALAIMQEVKATVMGKYPTHIDEVTPGIIQTLEHLHTLTESAAYILLCIVSQCDELAGKLAAKIGGGAR